MQTPTIVKDDIECKIINAFQWVAKACAKKDPRLYMNFLHVLPSDKNSAVIWVYATDGHRLHKAVIHLNDTIIEPGAYTFQIIGKKDRTFMLTPCEIDLGKLPEFERIFTHREGTHIHTSVSVTRTENAMFAIQCIAAFRNDGTVFDPRYFEDAAVAGEWLVSMPAVVDADEKWHVSNCTMMTLIEQSQGYTAVIMPFRSEPMKSTHVKDGKVIE